MVNRIPIAQQQRIGQSLPLTQANLQKQLTPLFQHHSRVPITELAARELDKSAGSLSSVPNGRLIRISGSDKDWDISTEWQGREINGWKKRVSHWDKMITITFHIDANPQLPIFTLALKPPLTDEEVATSADTYMMLLNLARQEM